MPDFTVRIRHAVIRYTDVTITAEDEDAAYSQAEALAYSIVDNPETFNKLMIKDKAEWELDEDQYEVIEVWEDFP